MAIEAKELQMEVIIFLQETNTTYYETLELIHTNFKVHKTSERLCDTIARSGTTAIMQRGTIDDDILTNKTGIIARTTVPFPNNHSKLLLYKYYW